MKASMVMGDAGSQAHLSEAFSRIENESFKTGKDVGVVQNKFFSELCEPLDEKILRQQIIKMYSPLDKEEEDEFSNASFVPEGKENEFQEIKAMEQYRDAMLASIGVDINELNKQKLMNLRAKKLTLSKDLLSTPLF